MKNSCFFALFLFVCFSQSIIGIAVDGVITNPVIEQITAFMLDSEYNRSLVVGKMLKNYIQTGNDRFLRLAMTMIRKDDPLYIFLEDYFAKKESNIASEN